MFGLYTNKASLASFSDLIQGSLCCSAAWISACVQRSARALLLYQPSLIPGALDLESAWPHWAVDPGISSSLLSLLDGKNRPIWVLL